MKIISDTIGVLLAGGMGRRMGGGDKSLKEIGQKQILELVIERTKPQVETLLLNANGNLARFEHFGLPLVSDAIDGFAGPLAGILTGLEWAISTNHNIRWVVSFATDAPFIPINLVEKFKSAAIKTGSDVVCASSSGQNHPVFALWPVAIAEDLRYAMTRENIRKIDKFTAKYQLYSVKFSTDPVDPFFNINNPENLKEAELLYQKFYGAGQL